MELRHFRTGQKIFLKKLYDFFYTLLFCWKAFKSRIVVAIVKQNTIKSGS